MVKAIKAIIMQNLEMIFLSLIYMQFNIAADITFTVTTCKWKWHLWQSDLNIFYWAPETLILSRLNSPTVKHKKDKWRHKTGSSWHSVCSMMMHVVCCEHVVVCVVMQHQSLRSQAWSSHLDFKHLLSINWWLQPVPQAGSQLVLKESSPAQERHQPSQLEHTTRSFWHESMLLNGQ